MTRKVRSYRILVQCLFNIYYKLVTAICSKGYLPNFYVTVINKDAEEKKGHSDWNKGQVGRDQTIEFLEGREPRQLNFLRLYCNITIRLYFDLSFYHKISFTKTHSKTYKHIYRLEQICYIYISYFFKLVLFYFFKHTLISFASDLCYKY